MLLDRNLDPNFKVMLGKTSDSNGEAPRIDRSTHALLGIDYAHHEIHAGSVFTTFHTLTGQGDGDYLTIFLTTPSVNECHMFWDWRSSGAAYFRIREGAVVTGNTGTARDVYNRNRGSSKLSGVLNNATDPIVNSVSVDVTIADRTASVRGDKGGLMIHEEYGGAGKSTSGGSRAEEEIILMKNTSYVFEVESDAAGNSLNLRLGWYEHYPKS